MNVLSLIFGPIMEVAGKVLDKLIPDAGERERIKAEMQAQLLQANWQETEAKMKVIVAEASGNWIQRSWRPILMLTIVGIVANNYLLYPYINLFFKTGLLLELPEELWSLMQIGVGGYIVGRSAESVSKNYFAAKKENGK